MKEIILQDPQGCLSCLFMLIVFGGAWLSVTGKTRSRPYIKPKITSARISQADLWSDGQSRQELASEANYLPGQKTPIGEFEVESSHSSHVTREFQLPSGAWIKSQGNGKYKVQFDLPAYMFRTDQPQEVHDKWFVESLAQANGYEGKVRKSESEIIAVVVTRKSVVARVLRLIGVGGG